MRLALSKRFRGLFWTQLLGAFNDNFLKYALLILIVFKGFGNLSMSKEELSEIATAIFIVPFFLFSATAGQLADKYDKARLIQRLKIVELVIAALAGFGFFFHSVPALFGSLALLGLQSTFFGPLKYGIIPQLLKTEDLVEGNAAVETGTKLSILLGTISGGLLAETEHAELFCSLAVFLVALSGYCLLYTSPSPRD